MNPFCNLCGGPLLGCGHCGHCQPDCGCKKKCPTPCGCPEQILSIEADTARPALLRFNLGGRSVWHDFTNTVKSAETCTSLKPNITARTLVYDSECGRDVLTAAELGSVLHLADIGDVDATSIRDNAILVYRKDADCGEDCEGKNGWIGLDPSEDPKENLSYILGTDEDGRAEGLQTPEDTNVFSYLAWQGANKIKWHTPQVTDNAPLDGDLKKWAVYVDPSTRELIIVKEAAQ